MAYSVLIQNKVAAQTIDSLNRPVVSASAVENGFVFNLLASASASGSEVWQAEAPVTGSLIDLWMAYEPEIVVTTSGTSEYRGLNNDPRNFIVNAGTVFSAFKPQVGDIITLSTDGMSNTRSAEGYAVAANGALQLAWASAIASGLTLKYLETTYMSIPNGTLGDTQRTTAYRLEVIRLQ